MIDDMTVTRVRYRFDRCMAPSEIAFDMGIPLATVREAIRTITDEPMLGDPSPDEIARMAAEIRSGVVRIVSGPTGNTSTVIAGGGIRTRRTRHS